MAHLFAEPTVEYSQDSATYAGEVTHTLVVFSTAVGSHTVSSFAGLRRSVLDGGEGASIADVLVTRITTGVAGGASSYVIVSATAQLRTASAAAASSSVALGRSEQFRACSAVGSSSSTALRVRTAFRGGAAAGSSAEGVVDLYQAIRSAVASGGATTGDSAIGLRTAIGFAWGFGLGSRIVQSKATLRRVSVVSGGGSGSAVGVRTAVTAAADVAFGASHGVFWLNGGQPWEAVIRTRPMSLERAGGRTFRRGVNYSVRLR